MQAETKSQQMVWARAFSILFEVRARVEKGLMSSFSIGVYENLNSTIADMVLEDAASTGFEIDESKE